ncbi:glycosyltransferase family protein [Rufibacter roseus]|uniref:Glycosyltransferase family protein n=1 Tax=Rufibacter roseus TaxID=1567108 RepID=A0ABW2DHX8_9BACT|nr:glycosyltransferase family protein [Rufibacter roseus]
MRILYGVQGTGNGHLTRALDIIPALQQYGEVDIVVSGCQVDLTLPFPVKYRLGGMSFIFGKKGGINFKKTFAQLNSKRFYKEVKQLPVQEYDLVLTDFEPITAWACYFAKKPCIGLSNQCAVLSPHAPRPKRDDLLGRLILKNYAPVTAQYGFHFARFDQDTFTPIIRQQVRELVPQNQGHYTVYLPAHDDDTLVHTFSHFPQVNWQVFSKHNKTPFQKGNVQVFPIQNDAFLHSIASSAGVICAAGFGTPSEALFLGKKLLVIPMKNQYEQTCNAAALKYLGVTVIKSLKSKHFPTIQDWLEYGTPVAVEYPDQTQELVHQIVQHHAVPQAFLPQILENTPKTLSLTHEL